MSSDSLVVFNIGFSAEVDGPGQRMVVYCKGCNLCCPWCAAPESVVFEPQVLFYADRVSDASEVVKLCPHGAVASDLRRDTTLCVRCDSRECIASKHPAFEFVGNSISIDRLVKKAKRYRPFFGSRGGVTIGGGEPTCQFAGLTELLKALKDEGIHTAIETNGTHPDLPSLYDCIDLLYIDLKHPDPSRYTGNGAEYVLPNIAARFQHGGEMVVRIPLIDGFNTDEETVHLFGRTLSAIGSLTVELLPYHSRAAAKWKACGLSAPDGFSTPTKQKISEASETLTSFGLTIVG